MFKLYVFEITIY